MRFLRLPSLFLFLLMTISCYKKSSAAKVICITYDYGDGMGHVFLGTELKSIDSSYQNDKFLKESIELYNGASKYLVGSEAINYLSKYINSYCKLEETSNGSFTKFIIRVYSENGVAKCCYTGNTEVKKYFEGMIAWINKSKYKSEFKELLPHLKLYVDNR